MGKYGQQFTLYAQWEPIKYKVRFNGNGNWNTAQGSYTQEFVFDQKQKLLSNKFNRNAPYNGITGSYSFIGWAYSGNESIPTFSNEQEVINLSYTDKGIVDLYALWKKDITLTFNMNGGKYQGSSNNVILKGKVYNATVEYVFNINNGLTEANLPYYAKQENKISAYGKYDVNGLSNQYVKVVDDMTYRFLGWSLDKSAKVPDSQLDIYNSNHAITYAIKDNTTLYAVWEPVLQMTVQLSAPQYSGVMQLTSDVPVTTTLGNFKISSGTRSTDIPSSATASVNSAIIGTNVTNKDLVTYTVSAKGASNIKFSTAADSRILDIYTHGNNNTWFDKLNTTDKFEYTIDNFSNTTSSFTIPQYIGTTKSYKTSNPESATGTSVYAIKFTCTQPSYYYSKYWNSPETTSVYGILFLNPTLPDDNTNVLPPYAVEDGAYEFETILN